MKLQQWSWLLLLAWLAHGAAALETKSTITPSKLTAEFKENPVGLGTVAPRLSWIVTSAVNNNAGGFNLTQSAYQIQASLDASFAAAAVVWDTGQVQSNTTVAIEYAGQALQPRERVYWRVRVWDQRGVASPYSTNGAFFELALLTPGDWAGATWIARSNASMPTNSCAFYSLPPAPLMRKQFELPHPAIGGSSTSTKPARTHS